MKLCVLYSGGKDSNLALYKASREFEILCLVNFIPESSESMLFHFPNSKLTKLQAKAMSIPIIQKFCKDDEESQVKALEEALIEARREFGIEGVVTGAVKSNYQYSRFRKVCGKIGLKCINPLWMEDEEKILKEILKLKFEAIITRIAGYPFEPKFLGRKIDEEFLEYLRKAKMNIAGEGGEYETFVTWMPLFKKRIKILEGKKIIKEFEGEYLISKADLCDIGHLPLKA